MTDLFIKVLNVSISASWVILAVLLLRIVLKKTPKWVFPMLWAVVGIRLVLPFSIESVFSLIPSREVVSPQIVYVPDPIIDSGIPVINDTVNPVISQTFAPQAGASANPLQILLTVAGWIWLTGVAVMILCALCTYLRLHRRLRQAICLQNNIYESERVSSPFVLGLFRPRIYLPMRMPECVAKYVIDHENAHIARKDHWIKPIAFLILSVYWFNPMLWPAYLFLCRDIELVCDERAVKCYDRQQRADYSAALLHCSISRKVIAACPLAFGEVCVKKRVKNVLNYKKPAFWMVACCIVVCVILAACFLTDPRQQENVAQLPAIEETLPERPEKVEVTNPAKENTALITEKYALVNYDPEYPYDVIDSNGVCKFTFLDRVENEWEKLVYEYYQCMGLADFDGLRQIYCDDVIRQAEVDIIQQDYEAGRFIESYTLYQLYTLTPAQLKYINEYYQEGLQMLLETEALQAYAIVCADVSWVSSEERLEAGPQFPDGRCNRYFLVGRAEKDRPLKLYRICWDNFLLAPRNMVGSIQEEVYLKYMDHMLEDPHEAQKKYVYFHTQELYDLALESKSELYSYEVNGWQQLSGNLWSVYVTMYSDYTPEGSRCVNFVGKIDGKFWVIPGVAGLPEELKNGINLSMFDPYCGMDWLLL